MLFAMTGIDRPNALELRVATRPAHLEYIAAMGKSVVFVGPFLDDHGAMAGSLVIIEAADRAEAEAAFARDPYVAADLFARVEIRPFKIVINNTQGR